MSTTAVSPFTADTGRQTSLVGRAALRRLRILAALALSTALAAAPSQQPVFRGGIDLLSIDVAVVDRDGQAVRQLGPEAFVVSVDGKNRRVVSVEFVAGQQQSQARADEAAASSPGRRPIVVAFDDGSFVPGTGQAPAAAVRRFIDALDDTERVGLHVLPGTSWIPPTTQRVPLRLQLGGLTGQRPATENPYNLRIFEVVDITTHASSGSSISQIRSQGRAQTPRVFDDLDILQRVWSRECPADPDCAMRIYSAGTELAARLERQAQVTVTGLDILFQQLAPVPGRKAVVLVTAGLVTSDRPGGRPDLGNVANRLSQMAAAARTILYIVHVDPSSTVSAGVTSGDLIRTGGGRDQVLLGAWLDTLATATGGRRIFVSADASEGAFHRVVRESTGHYAVAIEREASDLDGRPRRLQIAVKARSAEVRSPAWLVAAASGGP